MNERLQRQAIDLEIARLKAEVAEELRQRARELKKTVTLESGKLFWQLMQGGPNGEGARHHNEIADMYGLPVRTVRSRIREYVKHVGGADLENNMLIGRDGRYITRKMIWEGYHSWREREVLKGNYVDPLDNIRLNFLNFN